MSSPAEAGGTGRHVSSSSGDCRRGTAGSGVLVRNWSSRAARAAGPDVDTGGYASVRRVRCQLHHRSTSHLVTPHPCMSGRRRRRASQQRSSRGRGCRRGERRFGPVHRGRDAFVPVAAWVTAGYRFVKPPANESYGSDASVVVAGLVLLPFSLASMAAAVLRQRWLGAISATAALLLGCFVCRLVMPGFAVAHHTLAGRPGHGRDGPLRQLHVRHPPGLTLSAVPASDTGSAAPWPSTRWCAWRASPSAVHRAQRSGVSHRRR
jgi:hypothetical protein